MRNEKNDAFVSFFHIAEDFEKLPPVLIIGEDVLFPVTPIHGDEVIEVAAKF